MSVGYVREDRRKGGARGSHPVRRLVISLRGAKQRERLERSRAELVSTVAHELRSPLTSVKGFTATLLNKWGRFTDDQKRVMLETVNADADRVTRLIANCWTCRGSSRAGWRSTGSSSTCRSGPGRSSPAGSRPATPRSGSGSTVLDGLPETWLDADKIDQILGNLVENAVRHGAGIVDDRGGADPPGGRGRTGISPTRRGVRPRPGGGDPARVAARVFRQFWRGKPRGGSRQGGHGGGTGLGLYIVKGLVEAHGGTISVGRAPGGGAEFRFIVPAGGCRLRATP